MPKQRFDLDRSCAFTCLLDLDPNFGRLDWRDGIERVTEFLTAWYQSDSMDMFAFCREWLQAEKTHTISIGHHADWHTLESAREALGQLANLLGELKPGESLTIRRHK